MRNARFRCLTHLAALLLVCAPAMAQPRAVTPLDLDAYVQRVMKSFDVPGIAVAIVKDDAVVVARGYGVRRLGEPTPVDGKTLFGIASNTKVFTAASLGLLVEQGKLQWDAPVVNYLPWFQLYDPYVTREMTIRDLLVHRSGLGLGAGDLLWWPPSTYNRKDIASRLRYIKPATPAGGINSRADDMAKWLKVLLNEGQLADGSRLFSQATWRQLTTPVTPEPNGPPPPATDFSFDFEDLLLKPAK